MVFATIARRQDCKRISGQSVGNCCGDQLAVGKPPVAPLSHGTVVGCARFLVPQTVDRKKMTSNCLVAARRPQMLLKPQCSSANDTSKLH